jgi:hypothetical protein
VVPVAVDGANAELEVDPRRALQVHALQQVAELDAVLDPDVLMLVGEGLVRLGETRGAIAWQTVARWFSQPS